ncbi:hypothetical protein AX15_005263 [Amanita polypyramis BW_CC]|nr:hypothetical protein AX15_005263 [Amanita polypyramis BW_CC]
MQRFAPKFPMCFKTIVNKPHLKEIFVPIEYKDLKEWKRGYSNKDTRGAGGALEWFYQNFDSADLSIWRVYFKYNEELTLTFMSSNQVGGFFIRLDASRKYSVDVIGETNNSVISGAYILRGLEHEPLDISKDADKAFFEAVLAWDLESDDKKWADGKSFK